MAKRPVDPVEAYAKAVVAGNIIAGPLVRLACDRHLRDLADGHRRGLVWDWGAGKRVCDFFSDVLVHYEGEYDGKPFTLAPFQVFKTACLFGWKRKADGYRRFRVAYVEEGKGSGKSPWAAGVGLYMLVGDDESAAQVYSAAVDKDQASVVFRAAVQMVNKAPALDSRLQRSGGPGREYNLAFLERASFFRPMASENQGRGKSGFLPHCTILDEVHEHKTGAMVRFMRAGVKSRRQPLTIMITNSGWDRESICFEQHEYGRKVVEGSLQDDEYFAFICGVDDGDDPLKDESCWVKANPNMGVSLPRSYLEACVREARAMPGQENLTRRLNFCQWTEASQRAIPKHVWDACDGEVDRDALKGARCVAALDLSGRKDLSSLCLLFDCDDAVRRALWWHWLPEDGLQDREEREGIPWTVWKREGWLRTTPGPVVDRDAVAAEIKDIFATFEPWGLAYDRYRVFEVLSYLEKHGVTGERFPTSRRGEIKEHLARHPGAFVYVDWGQGPVDMEPACDALDTLLAGGLFRHGGNPIARFCCASLWYKTDSHDNRSMAKMRSSDTIDAMLSLGMAAGLREISQFETSHKLVSIYETRELLTL